MTSSSSSHLTIEDAGRNFQDFSEEHVKCCSNTLIAKNQRWIISWYESYERCSFELKALQAAEIWGKRKFQPQFFIRKNLWSLHFVESKLFFQAAAGLKQMGKLPPDQLKSYLSFVEGQRPWSMKRKQQKQPLHPYTRIYSYPQGSDHPTTSDLEASTPSDLIYLSRDKEPRAERLWSHLKKCWFVQE